MAGVPREPLRIRVRTTGSEDLRRALARVSGAGLEAITERVLDRVARDVQTRSQRDYLSGQVLQKITGELFRSIEIARGELPRAVEIGSVLVQSELLHFGLRRIRRAHPFLFPAAEAATSSGQLESAFVAELEAAVRAA